MIDKVGYAGNAYKKQPNFTGNAQIVRKEMYSVAGNFEKLFNRVSKKSNSSFLDTLTIIFKRPQEEIAKIFSIKNVEKLNDTFKSSQGTLKQFLEENGFVNKEGVFDKLPAKLAVLENGDDFVDENLAKLADKVVIKGGEFIVEERLKGNRVVIRNLQDSGIDIFAKTINAKNAELGKLITSGNVYAHNVRAYRVKAGDSAYVNNYSGGKITARGDVKGTNFDFDMHGFNSVNAGSSAYLSNYSGGSIKAGLDVKMSGQKSDVWGFGGIKAENGFIKILGDKNSIDGKIVAKKDFVGENLDTCGSITSQNGSVEIYGTHSNIGGNILAGTYVEGENINVDGDIVADLDIYLRGKNFIKGKIHGRSADLSSNTVWGLK